jgi:hypothetical protein
MFLYKKNFRSGITLVELIITILAAVILILGISGILAAGHKNFKTMFGRTTSDVVRNAYEARIIFDKIVRKSIGGPNYILSGNNDLTVYYYSDPNVSIPDKYSRFYLTNNDSDPDTEMVVASGDLDTSTTGNLWDTTGSTTVLTVAHNVSSLKFTVMGDAIRMDLVLNNKTGSDKPLETLEMKVTTTALRHNMLPD